MASMFNEDGTYNKTEWKAGDKITASKLNKIEESLEAINNNDISRHVEVDTRLDALEEQAAGQNEVTNERIEELNDLVLDNKEELDLEIYDINSRMTFLEEELSEGIEEIHNVAETVDGKIATAEANMTAQVDQGKADMEAMVAEVEADLEGLHAKDDELSAQLEHVEERMNDCINVKEFGAKGDGISDDREAIQQAIDVAVNNGGGDVIFPHGVYKILSTHPSYSNNGLVINGDNISLKGYGLVEISAGISMADLIHIPDTSRYLRMENLNIDAEWLADYCFNGSINYSPYALIRHCQFIRANITNMKFSTYVSHIDHCNFIHGITGLHICPIGDNICTSTTLTSCYVNNMQGEYGYYLQNLMYSALNSCACDNIGDGVAYKFAHARGLSMNSCGAEKCKKCIYVGSWRGMTINSFYGLNNGGDDVDYMIEFVGGEDATISGVHFNECTYSYILGLTGNSYGYENITITDGSIQRSETYTALSNWKYGTSGIKCLRDETYKDLSYECTANELVDVWNALPNTVNHKVTITLTDSSLENAPLLRYKNGCGRIIIDLNNNTIASSTPANYGFRLMYVSVPVTIMNGVICQTNGNASGFPLRIESCSFVSAYNVTFSNTSGGNSGACVSSANGSIVKIHDCTVGDGTFTSNLNADGYSIINGTL